LSSKKKIIIVFIKAKLPIINLSGMAKCKLIVVSQPLKTTILNHVATIQRNMLQQFSNGLKSLLHNPKF